MAKMFRPCFRFEVSDISFLDVFYGQLTIALAGGDTSVLVHTGYAQIWVSFSAEIPEPG